MFNSTSLTNRFFFLYLVGILMSVVLIGGFWIHSNQKQIHNQTEILKKQAVEKQMTMQKVRVEDFINRLMKRRNDLQKEARHNLQRRVSEALTIAENIYTTNKDRYSRAEIIAMIRAALEAIRFQDGEGYYFAADLNGVIQLYPPAPQWAGTNALELIDGQSKREFSDAVELVRTQGEGYLEYNWPKLSDRQHEYPKISYIKYFAPLDWFIGSGGYLSDITDNLKQELTKRIDGMELDDGSCFFLGNYQGEVLAGPLKEHSQEEGEERNAERIRNLIELAQNGGGYLHHDFALPHDKLGHHRVSYVAGIPGWGMYIGNGGSIAEIDPQLARLLAQRKTDMRVKVATIIGILSLLLLVGTLFSYRLKLLLRNSFREFQNFFDDSVKQATPLDLKKQSFSEFRALAQSANLMLEKRRQIEATANAYRNQLRNIIDAMPSLLAAIDEAGRIIEWNQHATGQTGITRSAAQGRNAVELLPCLDAYLDEIIGECCQKHRSYQAKCDHEEDGSIRNMLIFAYPLDLEDSCDIVIRIDDVTEQAQLEEMMIQTEKMLSIGSLAAGMAHEINNPLSIISQSAQNIGQRLAPEVPANRRRAEELGIDLDNLQSYLEQRQIRKFLGNISSAVERSSKIIQNMLIFTNDSTSSRESCSLYEITHDALALTAHDYDLRAHHDFKNIAIINEVPVNLPPIRAIHFEIQQVVFNILKNAGQALHKEALQGRQPEIRLAASASSKTVTLTISDNGPGIPEPIRKRIVEPFFSTKNVGEGTGLGLSVAYSIVTNRHQGQFFVDSKLGRGTTFSIILPRATVVTNDVES
ncbi:MAG: hypothetical protein C0622_06415 [Desulfuromonas sp.]|nr:MAG: hypothetical protein C0622_06415 [Desulfuromonas sp.]